MSDNERCGHGACVRPKGHTGSHSVALKGTPFSVPQDEDHEGQQCSCDNLFGTRRAHADDCPLAARSSGVGSVAVEDVRARTIAEIVRALQTEPVIPDDMEDGLYEPVEALKCAAVWIWREFSRSSTGRPEQPEPDVLGGQTTGGTSDA